MIIRKVGPLSCAKVGGIIYAALGLLIGAAFFVLALLGSAFSNAQRTSPMSPLLGFFMGLGALITCPILYGVVGFLSALIEAWLYNLIASKVGGIEIDVFGSVENVAAARFGIDPESS